MMQRWRDRTPIKPFRERSPILVGLISVGVLTVLMLFAFSLGSFTFLRGVYTVKADFADAAGLTSDNEVRIAGLKVGKVTSVELAKKDTQGVTDRVNVVMEISNGVKLGSLTSAEIKLKTILGAKFVDLAPKGGAPYVRGDDVIPISRTRIPYEIYQVANRTVDTVGTIDAKALNQGLRELATLFDDPDGNLGRALDGLSKASKGLKDRDAELQELVVDGGKILETVGSRSEALGRIFDSGAELLTALSQRRDALNRFVVGSNELAIELGDLLKDNRGELDPILKDLHTALLVVRKDIAPLEHSLKVLGPSAHSFGNVFLQGRWGDVWIASILDIALPPLGVDVSASSSANSAVRRPVPGVPSSTPRPVADLASMLLGAN